MHDTSTTTAHGGYSASEIVGAVRTLLEQKHSDAAIFMVLTSAGIEDDSLFGEPSRIMSIINAVKNAEPTDTSEDILWEAVKHKLSQDNQEKK